MYLTQALHRAVQQHPDRTAVRFGERHTSYAAFESRVSRLAAALQGLGLKAGDRVAMLSHNSDRYLEYQMAVPWAGGVMNPCNSRWSVAEVLYSLEDSGSTILFVGDAFESMAEEIRDASSTLRDVIYCGDGAVPQGMHSYEDLISRNLPAPDAMRRGEDLAGIFYTGGTTGFPKGVMLSHSNLCTSALALHAEALTPEGTTYLHAAPMFHLADLAATLALWVGGNAHSVIPSFDPEKVVDAIERDGVTFAVLVPTMLQMLADSPAMRQPRNLRTLRTVVYSASPMSEALLERVMRMLPGVDFVQVYGMTELAPLATVNPAWTHTPEGRRAGKLRSAGRAACCVELRIVDDLGHEVARGEVGEIAVRGPNVMQGYWKQPAMSALAIRDGWMHTGDLAYMDADGYVFIADRKKDMIISGGENIFSAEVENALSKHPDLVACAVIGIPSEQWGESVHAVVVRKPHADVSAEALVAHCRSMIAGYKCPRSVEFVEALPLSGAGKVLKAKLREPFWQGSDRQVA